MSNVIDQIKEVLSEDIRSTKNFIDRESSINDISDVVDALWRRVGDIVAYVEKHKDDEGVDDDVNEEELAELMINLRRQLAGAQRTLGDVKSRSGEDILDFNYRS